MTKDTQRDPEKGKDSESRQSTSSSSSKTSDQTFQGVSNIGDSSGPLFSIYYKAADEEDNKMTKGWQKDADGILIFTGLFSAALAALLAVTVQDLRPNFQYTSALYLSNISQFLADPNATRSSIPFPPPFTPPGYAIWVNSLWSLSLVMALSCALLATSLQQWARRYLHMAQPARCGPEERARMRSFVANGVKRMHVPWAVEGLPALLHLSLILFFVGLLIFLFNTTHKVFFSVVWWIGVFLIVYGLITLSPIFQHDSPYHSPLSTPAWFLYASITYAAFKFLAAIKLGYFCGSQTDWCEDLRKRYKERMSGGVEEAAKNTALERSSHIYAQILDWTISALRDDDSLKDFFKAIPGFFDSDFVKVCKINIDDELLQRFGHVSDGFLGRTWSSNAVDDEKVRRFDVATNAMNLIFKYSASRKSGTSFILWKNLFKHWDEMPQTLENGHILACWCTSSDRTIAQYAQATIARILVNVRERNDSWVTLAARISDLPEQDLRDDIALRDDSVLLAIFIHAIHQSLRSDYPNYQALEALSKLDICNTHSRMQLKFCSLWNDVRAARDQGPSSTRSVDILRSIFQAYIALHQGTKAAPTALFASTYKDDKNLNPSSFPYCHLDTHYPNSTPQFSVPLTTPLGNSPDALSFLSADGGDTDSLHTDEIGATPDMTPPVKPVYSISRPSPTAVPPTGSTTLPCLRARGLVNTGNMCFVNAVLQLLVNSPPFRDLFKNLGDLKRQRGARVPDTGGVVTPLVDATVKFFKEFVVDEESPSTPQQSQPATAGTSRADEAASFNPTDLYDAMEEKSQLKPLLDRKQQDSAEFLWQYLDALDEELPALLGSIGDSQSDVGCKGFKANAINTRMFGGKFRSPVRRPEKPELVPTDDWRSLYLDIQPGSIRTSQDILAHISQLYSVQVSASSSGDASQQALMEDLPPVLIFHLGRVGASGEMKMGESIQLEQELKIPLEIMAPNVRRPSEPPAHYKLYGVVYHQSDSTDGGHYTVKTRYPNGDSNTGDVWMHISDEAVSPPMQGVPLFREHVELVAKERNASLLFYCRPSA